MIWLIGNKGMLGSDIEKLLKKSGIVYCTSDREVDIIDYKALDKFVKDKNISWMINCAGYTRVDKAEEEIEESFRLNRDGVRNLALFSLLTMSLMAEKRELRAIAKMIKQIQSTYMARVN
jgi:dTDP-4-dehydrorhamnose reductase